MARAKKSLVVPIMPTGMTGTPKTINVAVLNGDTAATWAGKVRTALAADADVSAMFTVGGTTTSIVLTRKPLATYTIKGTSVPVYEADLASLNISLDNGTCTGITTAATSTDTAATATAGAYAPELDGNDFEGNAIGGISSIYGVLVENSNDSAAPALLSQSTTLAAYPLEAGGTFLSVNNAIFSDLTIEPDNIGAGYCKISVTIAASA